jgi:hypothetical protein
MARARPSPFAWLLRFALLASFLFVSQAMAGVYTVVADRDAFIKEDKANENNDNQAEVELKSGSGNTNQHRPLFGFTLPAIPANEYITSAILQLYVSRDDTITARVHRVTDTWTETTVTWANTATDIDATPVATFTPSPVNTTASIDITALAEAWRNGTYANNGVMLTTTTQSDVKFRTRETGTASQRPQLVITTARIIPALTVVKSSALISDPYNNTTNPKAIPGARTTYNITVTNTNAGTADSGTTVISDAVPSNMRLYVGDLGGAGSGPVAFTNGATSSGLTYTFTSLASTTDSIAFSNNGGSTWTYTPVPDANGYDGNVTNFRVTPTGTFNGASGGNNPSFLLQLRMEVR